MPYQRVEGVYGPKKEQVTGEPVVLVYQIDEAKTKKLIDGDRVTIYTRLKSLPKRKLVQVEVNIVNANQAILKNQGNQLELYTGTLSREMTKTVPQAFKSASDTPLWLCHVAQEDVIVLYPEDKAKTYQRFAGLQWLPEVVVEPKLDDSDLLSLRW